MTAAIRQDDALASNLYFAGIAIGILPGLFLALQPAFTSGNTRTIVVLIVTAIMLLAPLAGIGIAIRRGRIWAKIIALLLVGWLSYMVLKAVPEMMGDGLRILINALSLTLELGAAFIIVKSLLRRSVTERSGTPTEEVPVS